MQQLTERYIYHIITCDREGLLLFSSSCQRDFNTVGFFNTVATKN